MRAKLPWLFNCLVLGWSKKGLSSHLLNISLFPVTRWTHPPSLKWYIFRQMPCIIIQNKKCLFHHYACCGKAWINRGGQGCSGTSPLSSVVSVLCCMREKGNAVQPPCFPLHSPLGKHLSRISVRLADALEGPQFPEVSGCKVKFLNLAT